MNVKQFFDYLEEKFIDQFSMIFQDMKDSDTVYIQEGILREYEIERVTLFLEEDQDFEFSKCFFPNLGESLGCGGRRLNHRKEEECFWWDEFPEGHGFGFGGGSTIDNPTFHYQWDILEYRFKRTK